MPPNASSQRHDGWARLLRTAKGVNTQRVRCTALLAAVLGKRHEDACLAFNIEVQAASEWVVFGI
jgi:hypothetical protein